MEKSSNGLVYSLLHPLSLAQAIPKFLLPQSSPPRNPHRADQHITIFLAIKTVDIALPASQVSKCRTQCAHGSALGWHRAYVRSRIVFISGLRTQVSPVAPLASRESGVQRTASAKIEQESRVQASADSITARPKLTWILTDYTIRIGRSCDDLDAPLAKIPLTLTRLFPFHRLRA
jgi:hypothetical protein